MIAMYLGTFIAKFSYSFLSNLLSFSRLEVDTQQLKFPAYDYTINENF